MTGPRMAVTRGVDIGTHETKGVLVDANGGIVANASIAREPRVPG